MITKPKALSIVALLLAATVWGDDLVAQNKDVLAHFKRLNPASKHMQFRNTKIHTLYSCVESVEVLERDTCRIVNDFVSTQEDVVFASRKRINSLALNFFVVETPLPKEEASHEFDGCSFRRAKTSALFLQSRVDEQNLVKCILASTLIHLGFVVDDVVYDGLDLASFKRIVSAYTLDN
ncbi:hypothetical protein [Sinorhizobium meliloti]|uniref:hypothetical protein n=1 Tax=Rhizobium meliloti TaxID=382 RepID=UPI002091AC61|nr:hypothetical protein [Sinorhizobium meliloti]MCO5962377.1 hypothetical protein [Sinorhizobium meliloti]